MKKAFTVIELIAVIVVLAIILAITVPGITGIVKNSTMKAVESDAKLVLDSIRLKKIEDNTFDPITLTKSNVNNLLGLSDENYSALEVKINEGQTYIKITGQGKWSGFSACGTYFNMQVNEGDCYLDFNDPVITLLGDSFVSINVGQAYTDAGATANDVEDGDITGRIVKTGTVNPSVPGTYTITYNVSDTAGREAVSVTRTVYVIDVEAPVITILGANPVNINVGGTYSDAGATALDDADGDVTSRIVTTGTVNPSIAGTYTITYTVSDNAGHESTAVRTVNVIDNVLPTVSFSMNGNATWAKTRSTTVTVSDTHTGVNTSSLKYQWNTSTTAPTEASFTTAFTNGETVNSPVGVTGTYYLWVLAKDNAGNTTIVRTNLFNLDNNAPSVPTVNLNGYTSGVWTSGNVIQTYSSSDVDSGIQKYQLTTDGGISWADIPTNPWTINWDGQWTINIRAIDNVGNASGMSSSYIVRRDATPPSVPTVSLNGYTSNTWTKNDVTQTFSSSDATSGIQKYQYSVDSGASWGDLVGSWTINWDGGWTFYIRAVDNANNISGLSSAYVILRDTVAPVITMNGSSTVSIPQGGSYIDAGATATDNFSGLASAVQVTSNVNPSIVGTYTVTYNVSDNAGNAAATVTRTVNVVAQQFYAVVYWDGYSNPYKVMKYTGGSGTIIAESDRNFTEISAIDSNSFYATVYWSGYSNPYKVMRYTGGSGTIVAESDRSFDKISAIDSNSFYATMYWSGYSNPYKVMKYTGGSGTIVAESTRTFTEITAIDSNNFYAIVYWSGYTNPNKVMKYTGGSGTIVAESDRTFSQISAIDSSSFYTAVYWSGYTNPNKVMKYVGGNGTIVAESDRSFDKISTIDGNSFYATMYWSGYSNPYKVMKYTGGSGTIVAESSRTFNQISSVRVRN